MITTEGNETYVIPQHIPRSLPSSQHDPSQPKSPPPAHHRPWATPPREWSGAASSSETFLAMPVSSSVNLSSCRSPRPFPSQSSEWVSSVSISTSSASCAHLMEVSRLARNNELKEGKLHETGSLLDFLDVVNMFRSSVNMTNPRSNLEHFAKHASIFWMHVGVHGFPLAPSWTMWRRDTWTLQAPPASSLDWESGPRCLDMAQCHYRSRLTLRALGALQLCDARAFA